eukprot:6069779-Pyramimonas_sp.AAC.1
MMLASSGRPRTPLGPLLGHPGGYLGASRAVGRLTWLLGSVLDHPFACSGLPSSRNLEKSSRRPSTHG